jgi:hypothetical protein
MHGKTTIKTWFIFRELTRTARNTFGLSSKTQSVNAVYSEAHTKHTRQRCKQNVGAVNSQSWGKMSPLGLKMLSRRRGPQWVIVETRIVKDQTVVFCGVVMEQDITNESCCTVYCSTSLTPVSASVSSCLSYQ